MPLHAVAQLVKPTVRGRRIDECRRIDDLAGLVVDQRTPAGAEEPELRQG